MKESEDLLLEMLVSMIYVFVVIAFVIGVLELIGV